MSEFFVSIHASQLQAIGFPPSLIEMLEYKLKAMYSNCSSISNDDGSDSMKAGDEHASFQIVEEEIESDYSSAASDDDDVIGDLNKRRYLVSARSMETAGDVFIIDHVVSFPDTELYRLEDNLRSNPNNLCGRLSQMILDRTMSKSNISADCDSDDKVSSDNDQLIDEEGHETTDSTVSTAFVRYLMKTLWQYLGCYYHRQEHMWYVLDEVGSAIDHSDEPNVICCPFMYCYTQSDGSYTVIPCSLLWPLRHIDDQEMITRDFIPTVSSPKDRAARLIAWFPEHIDATVKQAIIDEAVIYNQLLQDKTVIVSSSLPSSYPIAASTDDHHHRVKSSKLPAITPCEGQDRIRVHCLWSIDSDGDQQQSDQQQSGALDPQKLLHPTDGLTDLKFQLVNNPDDADILWGVFPFNDTNIWTHPVMRSDHTSPVLINQFPYEGALVMKDHLAREIARTIGTPSWWPITYDLEVALTAFVGDFLMRERDGRNNIWIVKPSDGTRSKGHIVTDSLLRIIRSLETKSSRVAQKYIESPLLWKGRKFDMRFIVLLRSTDPLELYVYDRYWVRVANELYQPTDIDNIQAVFTAMHLLEGVTPNEPYPDCERFSLGLEEEYPGLVVWSVLLSEIHHMLLSLFKHVCSGQKQQMRCDHARAIYGCDVILEKKKQQLFTHSTNDNDYDDHDDGNDGSVPVPVDECGDVHYHVEPKLLEVTFGPANNALSEDFEKQYPSYINDCFNLLFFGIENNITRLA